MRYQTLEEALKGVNDEGVVDVLSELIQQRDSALDSIDGDYESLLEHANTLSMNLDFYRRLARSRRSLVNQLAAVLGALFVIFLAFLLS